VYCEGAANINTIEATGLKIRFLVAFSPAGTPAGCVTLMMYRGKSSSFNLHRHKATLLFFYD